MRPVHGVALSWQQPPSCIVYLLIQHTPRLVLWILCTSQMPMRWRVSWGVRILRGLQVRKPGWEHLLRGAHSGPWSQKHPLYRHKEVAAGVWWIEEKYFASSWNLANIYFIRGSEADLLIDTGVGVHQVIIDLQIVRWSNKGVHGPCSLKNE